MKQFKYDECIVKILHLLQKNFFEMVNYKINGPSFVLSCSEKVKIPLMVCSHERSGTHFMMNSISECTEYTVNPFLNFDYMPLGSFVNFFSKESMNKFLFSLQDISQNEYDTYCTALVAHNLASQRGGPSNEKCGVLQGVCMKRR